MSGPIYEGKDGKAVAFFDSFGSEPRRTPGQKFKRSNWDNREKHAKPGWVYLFALPDEWMVPLYKIGLSKNPIRRTSEISKKYGGDTVMIAACFKTDNMARDEEYFLRYFAEYRTNDGDEYFTLGPEQLTQFILDARELARAAGQRLRK